MFSSESIAASEPTTKAATSGQTDLTALVLPAGPISNFGLTSFTEPVKIQLINPLLGGNCYIGSDDDPIVLNPTIISGTLGFVPDRDPVRFPTTAVLEILDAVATDDTFSVPAATGCGPKGVANASINSFLGLPSPSGNNHLVLDDAASFVALPANGQTGQQFSNDWHTAFGP